MTVNCPLCRRPLDDGQTVPLVHLRDVRMAAQHKVIIDALVDAYPRPVRIGYLIDRLYADDPEGGPEMPERVVRQIMSRIRKELPGHGWTIPVNRNGAGIYGSYRLEPVKVSP